MTREQNRSERRRVVWGGVLSGLGLGGFFDGIVLHQILQWHHMVSNRYPVTTVAGLELNLEARAFSLLVFFLSSLVFFLGLLLGLPFG